MDVVPVIDLLGGIVVHARQGQRDSYRPIRTPLSATSYPTAVLAGLLRLHPFGRLYVADLDAIEGRPANDTSLAMLSAAAPDLDIWVDAGIGDAGAAQERLARPGHSLVIGSESQRDAGTMRELQDDPRVVLSLDFRNEAFQGPAQLLDDAGSWPRRVIVMTLGRVGAQAGPDIPRVTAIAARAGPGRAVYAAGGVRSADDLRALKAAGAAGALVATALHAGTLSPAEFDQIA